MRNNHHGDIDMLYHIFGNAADQQVSQAFSSVCSDDYHISFPFAGYVHDFLLRETFGSKTDYLINAGGLICVHYEHQARLKGQPLNEAEMMAHVERIAETAAQVFARADKEDISTALASDLLAEQRFAPNKAQCQAA